MVLLSQQEGRLVPKLYMSVIKVSSLEELQQATVLNQEFGVADILNVNAISYDVLIDVIVMSEQSEP